MKILGTIIFLTLALGCDAAEPDVATVIAEARSIMSAPDQWADISSELQQLDSLSARLAKKKKEAVESFRRSFASYSDYFAGRGFSLSPDERAMLVSAIRRYEEAFVAEQTRILVSRLEHPREDHGCLAAAELARFHADFELDRCGPVFSRHNWTSARPNELAGVFVHVMRDYGRLLADLAEEGPNSERSAAP